MVKTRFIISALLGCVLLVNNLDSQEKPRVVIVVGTHHYSPHLTLPHFAKELDRYGFETSVVMGEGDPESKTESVLPGIEALDEADIAIFYLRFLNLPEKEWTHVEKYIKSGKPVIGMRTANHAFKFPKDHPHEAWNNSFGRRVIGTPYVAHKQTKTNINLVKKYKTHPILTGVTKTTWESPAKLYLTRLEPGCVPLVTGEGEGPAKILEKEFGTICINESENDVVAWTWINEWGAKVFSTSLGHAGDFAEESFVRMLVNSVCWAGDHELPSPDEKITTWNIEMAVPSKYKERKK